MPNNLTVELPDLTTQGIAVPGGGREIVCALPLRGITILAVEDSRVTGKLLNHIGLSAVLAERQAHAAAERIKREMDE